MLISQTQLSPLISYLGLQVQGACQGRQKAGHAGRLASKSQAMTLTELGSKSPHLLQMAGHAAVDAS